MNLPELPPAQRTIFYRAIWELARQIPAGKVATYGQLAAYVPPPAGIDPEEYAAHRARWAGAGMAACPGDVPWQRVINAQGKISPRPGAALQKKLLEQEGVIFDAKERVDLKKHTWAGPV
jgi:methylated-DNA-protein-cysteine methyltransferase related protein